MLMFGSVVVLVVAMVLGRYRRRPQEPVAPNYRRTWRSFSTACQLWLLGVSVIALCALVAFAGSASSPDEEGRYTILEVDTGRYDGPAELMSQFFGWAYGLPVAAATAVMVVLTLTALHLNAVRPFVASATVPDEETSRSTVSALLVWFTTGAVLLTLSQALSLVSATARTSVSTGNYTFETTLAALAPWLEWAGLLAHFLGCTMLGLVIAAAFMRPPSSRLQNQPAPRGTGALRSAM